MKKLYEILVPTHFNDGKRIPLKHHKEWDAYVKSITGGLTILKAAKGQWIHEGETFSEEVIPVRIMCEEKNESFSCRISRINYTNVNKTQINNIIKFTLSHYKQKAVMAYVVSSEVNITYAK